MKKRHKSQMKKSTVAKLTQFEAQNKYAWAYVELDKQIREMKNVSSRQILNNLLRYSIFKMIEQTSHFLSVDDTSLQSPQDGNGKNG